MDLQLTDKPSSITLSVMGYIISTSDKTKWPPGDSQICTKSHKNGLDLDKCCSNLTIVDLITAWKLKCHSLYLLTNFLKHLTKTLGIILTVLSPLSFGFLPGNTIYREDKR